MDVHRGPGMLLRRVDSQHRHIRRAGRHAPRSRGIAHSIAPGPGVARTGRANPAALRRRSWCSGRWQGVEPVPPPAIPLFLTLGPPPEVNADSLGSGASFLTLERDGLSSVRLLAGEPNYL